MNNQATESLATTETTAKKKSINQALYRSIWRWHFYAGIFCIPFVILLAITGAMTRPNPSSSGREKLATAALASGVITICIESPAK